MVISVSVIFDTGYNYLCYSNKEYFVDIEEKKPPINIEVTANGLDVYGLGIVKYYFRSESGHIIVLQDQENYVPGLLKGF